MLQEVDLLVDLTITEFIDSRRVTEIQLDSSVPLLTLSLQEKEEQCARKKGHC